MRHLKNFFKLVTAFLCSTSLVGCCVMMEYILYAGEGEKDVSQDFKRGHVIGKEYELLQDLYLAQYEDSKVLYLSPYKSHSYTFKNGQQVDVKFDTFCVVIPRGAKFRVYSVFVKTEFGEELCSQRIYAHFIDNNRVVIRQKNADGKEMQIKVSSLFKNTNLCSNENWIFHPEPKWIMEINAF